MASVAATAIGTQSDRELQESQEFLTAAASEANKAVSHRQAVVAHVGDASFTKGDHRLLEPDDWRHTEGRDDITAAELQLAKRCHGAHIETLRYEATPVASHYQLIHYDVPFLDPETHVLRVHGLVDRELELSMADIRQRPASTHSVLLACAGIGRMALKKRLWTHVPWGHDAFGCSRWTGCSLADVLREAGLKDGAAQVIFTGADKGIEGDKVQYFQRSLSIDDAMLGHVLVCYQMNGQDLPPAHGAPVRLVVPGWYGMASVKWLTSIEVTSGGWWGHQMEAYSFRRAKDDPNMVPLQQLPPRALMSPPGCPDFFSRARLVAPGKHRIVGRAWAGAVDLAKVEFSGNGGATWVEATLGEKNGAFGWAPWHVDWEAEGDDSSGEEGRRLVLSCRATDTRGRTQDEASDEQFNWTGMGCTQPQQVYVRITSAVQEVGAHISTVKEHKAAKASKLGDEGLDPALLDALYRSPGSQ